MENPVRIQHRSKPSEPYAHEGQIGNALRITPAFRNIPAQALCDWGEFQTWEKLTDLIQLEVDD